MRYDDSFCAHCFCFYAPLAEGKIFSNSYISFEIPHNWKCKPYDLTWVCHSKLAQRQKEAMVVMVAKEAGALDTLKQYKAFLKNPRALKLARGTLRSKPLHVKEQMIHRQLWIDGLHKQSEVPQYLTRYLVTKCCGGATELGILLTMSAHEKHYAKYAKDFLKIINSLRVADIAKTLKEMKAMGAGESMGSGVGRYMQEVIDGADGVDALDDGSEGGPSNDLLWPLAALAAAVAVFVLYRRKKRKKRAKAKASGKSSRR